MTDLFEQSAAEYKNDPFQQSASEYKKDPFEVSAQNYNKSGLAEIFKPALETTKAYGRLAKDPMGVVAGALEFGSAVPGFVTGVVGAAQNIVKGFLSGTTDLEDLYSLASEGFKRESEKLPPYKAKGHPESHLVGETAMAPALIIMKGGHELADKIDDPDAKGALLFATDILALAGQAKAMGHGAKVPIREAAKKTELTVPAVSDFLKSEFEKNILGKEAPVENTRRIAPEGYRRIPTTREPPKIMPKGTYTDLGKHKRVPTGNLEPERIESAAIKLENGDIATGKTHSEAYDNLKSEQRNLISEEDGFVTDKGKYISRQEAVDLTGEVTEDAAQIVGRELPRNTAGPKQIKEVVEKRHGVGTFKKKSDTNILYSGIPPKEFAKVGNLWTRFVGEPIWDKLVVKGIPRMLEKVPGGKSVNRAMLYDYRENLKNTEKYITSMEDKTRNQSIGREYGVDLGNRMLELSEESQLKIAEYIKGENVETLSGVGKFQKNDINARELKLANETVDVFAELGKQATDLELLSEEVFFKNLGKYMPRLYLKHEYQTLLNQLGLAKPNRLDLSRFKTRKEIPKEIRQEMGEILTPGYPVAKGISQLVHDIEQAKFFSGIAKNPDWAIPKSAYRPKNAWQEPVSIPEGFVSLGKNKKLGALDDAYVHPEIFKDLQESIKTMDIPEMVWRKSLGYWKFGKVIISPKTHTRNLMSNSVLAHLGGMPMYEQPVYLTKAARAMKEKGEYWRIGKQEGLLRTTFTNAELRTLFDQVETNMQGVKGGTIVDNLGKVGQGWDAVKGTMKKAAKLYEAEEQWFKMAKMIHNMERRGMNAKTAAADAEKWLFNYEKVTKFQDKYRRKWYGAPFATFTFKAFPRVAEAAIKTPWRFALPAAMIYGLEKAAMNQTGETKEQFKAKQASRPEWQKGKFLGVIPNFARFPFVDEYGRDYNLNLTYILPWGDIAEGGDFMGIPGSVRPMSMPVVNEAFQQFANRDLFWKSDIVPEEELAGKSASDKLKTQFKMRGEHLAKTFLPTPVVDIEKAISSLQGKPDSRGRFRNPVIVAADILAGVKLYPVDYADELQKYLAKESPERGEIASRIRSQIKTFSIKRKALEKAGKSTKFYDDKIEQKVAQLLGMAKEVEEKSETFKKTK